MSDQHVKKKLNELRIINGFVCFKKGTSWINISHIEEIFPEEDRCHDQCYVKYKMINDEAFIESPRIFESIEDADLYIEGLLLRLQR